MRRAVPLLHAVTDDAVLARPGFTAVARAALEAGGDALALHLRGPRTEGRALHALAVALRGDARARGALLVVADRVDVALAAGADGVQLGARSLAPADARRVAGGHLRVGVSVHSAAEAREAGSGDPEWLLAGTIWPTPSHPGRPPAGPARLRELLGDVPVVAIGGVTPRRAGEARRAGAVGVAALRGIWDAPDPAEAVLRYLEGWREG